MALPLRLLGRIGGGGGRRGRLPPPLAGLAHLSAASPHRGPTHEPPSPAPLHRFPAPAPPFAVPARSFSWYSRSPAPAAAEGAPANEGASAGKEFVYLDDASTVDYGEELAAAAGGAADAAVGVAAGGNGGGLSGFAMDSLIGVLDGFHNLTGLPWWITISASTVAMRLIILPALIVQFHKTAKIGQLFRKLPPPLPPPLSGRSYRDQYSLFQKKRRELGCPSFLWNFAYFSVQFPCFILWMASIRSMCLSNHPGLDNGGILWFNNLTEFPHGALGPVFPILVAGLHYLNVQISFQKSQAKHYPGVLGLLAKYYKIYLDILAIPLFLIAYVVPQGSLVYWTTNGLFHVAQQLSLRNDIVRKMLGLPDTGALAGNTSPKSLHEGQKIMQRWPLGDSRMQSKLESSTTPKFMFEDSKIMDENVSAESSSPEELLQQALQYLGAGCQDQAVPLIRTAIEKNPDLHIALIGMGQTLFSNKLFPEASVCFEHAIPKIEEQDPLLVLAYFSAGLSRKNQGDKETAIKLLQRLTELKEPEQVMNKACYFQGFIALGSILSNEGRKSEAAKYLRAATAYDPGVERFLKECEEAMEDQSSQQSTEPPNLKGP
ncbi:ALBINO3-like protein 2, chloroplastic [Triticum dicoccoides]|uniref:ALBINO3-like protein 2, chloroplastic n=1 Tax=Triticum dicoccoides TaxID=85692 RepID=UPI0018910DE1|nr:ALBINO3-like protein 2, chloroplastic [Triticum dicoccoides]